MQFFTHDKKFYSTLLHLMLAIVLQNIVTYSVNMADNLMLGSFSQNAMSGAATVNMIQFMFQVVVVSLGDTVVVVGSQYWGQKRAEPVRKLTGIALLTVLICGILLFLAVSLFPAQIIGLFTTDEAIISEGVAYLSLIRYTYILYALTMVLMSALRTVGTVNISFGISVMSLIVDVSINYTLIFGHFGAPRMGIRGAAIGTLAARILELIVMLYFVLVKDRRLQLFSSNPFRIDRGLLHDYFASAFNVAGASLLWAAATPVQTGILGHLSGNAIAANSASTTLYQYLKVVTQGEASASAVLMGHAVGEGDTEQIRAYTRTLQIIYLLIGAVLSILLFFVRIPVLSLYALTPDAYHMADQILILLCVIMFGMSYQMPVSGGIIKGGGDTRFMLIMNLISTWGIVMPLSFMAAFWWKWPVVAVVACLNADQVFKCLPSGIYANRYHWIKKLTKDDPSAPEG